MILSSQTHVTGVDPTKALHVIFMTSPGWYTRNVVVGLVRALATATEGCSRNNRKVRLSLSLTHYTRLCYEKIN